MPASPVTALHERHIEAARRRVAHLGAMEHATDEAERRIADAAQKRLEKVEADLAKLADAAHRHDEAAGRYTELVAERGRLQDIIARAEHRLAPDA